MKIGTKKSIDELAILGGKPLFEDTLHVGRPNVMNRDAVIARINEAMDRNWLTNDGPLLNELENRFADFLQVKNCIAVANATLGIQLVAKALDVTGEVIVPSFTFIGTAHALAWIGLKVVFCDVLPENHTIDPQDVERKITEKTGAIVGVHLWGNASNIEALQKIADRTGVPLIFDAAHAAGCTYKQRPIGTFGAASVFSLHATKAINSLEGGLVTTNDDMLARKIRLMRSFGFVDEDQVSMLGGNAKMNEFSAAMGIVNLGEYDRLYDHNRGLYAAYQEQLSGIGGVRLLDPDRDEIHNHHYVVISVQDEASVQRDTLYRLLRAENIWVRRYFCPGCHRSLPYSRALCNMSLPVTEKLSDSILQLPTGMQMDLHKVGCLSELIKFCMDNGAGIEREIACMDNG